MFDILLQFDTAAATARAVAPIKKVMLAMLTTQSAPSAIDKATTHNALLFALYMFLLLLIAFVSWLVWKSGNRLQDEIRADANARIAEADGKAATANENAGKANERAQKLEGNNLTLRGQVATLETTAADAKKDVAGLQRDAADAKAAQQRVETDLAKQQARAATAEKDLLELQQQLASRSLSEEQRTRLINILSKEPGGVFISCKMLDTESCGFAGMLAAVFKEANWGVFENKTSLNDFSGFTVFVNSSTGIAPGLQTVLSAMRDAGIQHRTSPVLNNSVGQWPVEGTILIVVGRK